MRSQPQGPQSPQADLSIPSVSSFLYLLIPSFRCLEVAVYDFLRKFLAETVSHILKEMFERDQAGNLAERAEHGRIGHRPSETLYGDLSRIDGIDFLARSHAKLGPYVFRVFRCVDHKNSSLFR